MKMIKKATIPLVLVIATLASCNSFTSPTSPTDVIETAMPTARTAVVETQETIPAPKFALPTSTLLISLTPTDIPSGDYSNNYAAPPGKLDYAKKTLRKHHALLPYVNDVKEIYGLEYYGCVETDDFGGGIGYDVASPIETVNSAFIEFFRANHWEFVEPIRGFEMGVPSITYEVYRISTEDKPAFERLEVVLYDFTAFTENGKSQTKMSSNLIHIENRKYLNYVFDFSDYPCRKWYAFNTGW